jgi:hypothetical protein
MFISRLLRKTNVDDALSQFKASQTLCAYRWNYLIVNLQTGKSRTCCLTPKRQITAADIERYGTDVFLNTDYLKERRQEMFKGVRHSDCQSCWSLEDKGVISKRTSSSDFVVALKNQGSINQAVTDLELDHLWGQSVNKNNLLTASAPRLIEINLGNSCDLKCTYCNHWYSSQWAKELIEFGEIDKDELQNSLPRAPEKFEETFWSFLERISKSELVQINILGGEPLFSPQLPSVVDRLFDIFKDVDYRPELGIVTNLNAQPHVFDRFMTTLERLKEVFFVHIQPSIETVGERAEYIRHNLSWNRFDNNVNTLLSRKQDLGLNRENFYFTFLPAINTLSISSLYDFIVYCREISERHNIAVGVGSNIVTDPASHDPTILTPDYETYVTTALKAYYDHRLYGRQQALGYHRNKLGNWKYFATSVLQTLQQAIANQGYQHTEKHIEFADFVFRNDSRRGVNFLKTFPEYEDFLMHCQKNPM